MSTHYEGVGSWAASGQHSDPTLERVRALWASSTDESYPEELRESYRTRAEALMFKHRITLATLGEQGESLLGEPEWRVLDLYAVGSEYWDAYETIVYTLLQHCELRGTTDRSEGRVRLEVVGFPADLGYFELLLTSCLLAFGSRLEPQWDTSISFDENVYRLRAAGWERGRIARKAWPAEFADLSLGFVNKTLNKRVSAIYEREAAKRDESTAGVSGRGANVGTYRKSYAEAFVSELWRRLSRMRIARGQESAAIILKSVKEKVDEAYYIKYPSRRPRPASAGTAGVWRAPNADCARCKKAKGGFCREHSYLRMKKRAERPWSEAGYARGEAAARTVDLGRAGSGRVGADSGYREVEG